MICKLLQSFTKITDKIIGLIIESVAQYKNVCTGSVLSTASLWKEKKDFSGWFKIIFFAQLIQLFPERCLVLNLANFDVCRTHGEISVSEFKELKAN